MRGYTKAICLTTGNKLGTPEEAADGGKSVTDRRAYNFSGTTSAPSLYTDGFSTAKQPIVRLVAQSSAAGAKIKVYEYDYCSEGWVEDLEFGEATLPNGSAVQFSIEVRGSQRIAVRCTAHSSGSVGVWLMGVCEND